LAALGGCSIDDADRCLSGYAYDKQLKTCLPPRGDSGADGALITDTGPTADMDLEDTAPAEAGTDAQPADDSSGASIFGEPCQDSWDCVGDADYCLFDPINQVGVCTYDNCTADSCPKKFQCCDCTGIGLAVICAPENEPTLESMCSCMAKN
jgi:hypothetical protein